MYLHKTPQPNMTYVQGSDNRRQWLKYHTIVRIAQKYATREQNAHRW